MRNPAVSVLLPVRNALPHLHRAIRSLNRQTIPNFEVVAVDDGSTDGSSEVLEEWAANDPRVRVVRREIFGLVAALNDGLSECRAPVVARMDADDISHPRRLQLQTEFLEKHPGVDVVSCLVRHFPWHRVGQGFRLYEEWLNSLTTHGDMALERFVESPLAHPSTMLRRRRLEEIGGYRDLGWPEDYDLWLRLIEAGATLEKIGRFLYFWREHPERLTRLESRYSTDAFLRCKAEFLLRGPLAGKPRVLVWGAGQTGKRLSRYLIDGNADIAAFIDIDPDKVDREARGRPILPPERVPEYLAPGTVVLAAVASRGAREQIRERLRGIGLVEGRGFWCVA